MSQNIVFLHPMNAEITERVARYMPRDFALSVVSSIEREHVKAMIGDADYAVVVDIAVDETLLRAAPKLKLLHKWGVGVDNLALDAARMLGIKVARTTGANATPVAEFTLGLMLGSLRGIVKGHGLLRQGIWAKDEVWRESFMLTGKTVGLVGFGPIGQRVAELLAPFRCRVLYTKRTRLDPAEEQALGVTYAALPELLAQSDIVSLHCALTPQTRGLIGRAELTAMKSSALLLNLARGGVVSEADLVWALETGEIRAAATDVYETEPVDPGHPLLRQPNAITTPHCAAVAVDNFHKSVEQMFHNIQCVAQGEPIPARDLVVG